MKLRHLAVKQFRCIKNLDWLLNADFLCLVGPGDIGKSTILDAIELVLSPRWNPVFDDCDFYKGDTSEPLTIEATIGALPRRLLSDAHFGLRLRGLSEKGVINDEPQEGDEEVVTIRLSVDSSLEPVWHVVTDRHPDGAHINARERERLGLVRLGSVVDRDLTWSRGSVLSRLTGDFDEHAQLLAEAGRHARGTVDKTKLPRLSAASSEAESLASAFGVLARNGFEPRLDAGTATLGAGGLALHDGLVPIRRAGLGSRRLVSLAVQRHIARNGGAVLVDEVEHGLEPFRLRRLLAELLRPSVPRQDQNVMSASHPKSDRGSVLMTTHSPVVLTELQARQLRIVRSSDGVMSVLTPPESVQPVFRENAEAFLSSKVIVCEGKTELGVLRGLDDEWTKVQEPFASRGVGLAYGGGSTRVGGIARAFAGLGYQTAVFADSDQPLDVPASALATDGILVVQWDAAMAIEQRVFLDLPWAGVVEAVVLATELHGGEHVRAQVASALLEGSNNPADLGEDVNTWPTTHAEQDLRQALGRAAKSKSNAWYKRVDLGAELGKIIASHLSSIPTSDLALKIDAVRKWIFNGRS